MGLTSKMHRLVDLSLKTPGIKQLIDYQNRREFIANRNMNMFLGIHSTWEEAELAAKEYGLAGYDNVDSSSMYLKRIRMDEHDYPPLYWITQSLGAGMRSVFDVGGATGIKFYAFREELSKWSGVSWTVFDVPTMAKRGREVADEQGVSSTLKFSDRFEDGNGVDIVYASGVLQYLPHRLGDLVASLSKPPKRIIINTAAIHAETEFFTVNSIGTAFCPYRVQTQANLIRGLTKLGYKLRESWRNPGKPLTIPQQPKYSLHEYAGFVLDRVQP
jgi:putative methyltransferase (TIGR04325 family)